VLQIVIEGVNALLGTERTSVFLIDEETGELVLRYSNDGNAEIRLPAPWQGIAGWVATHDMPTLVNDAPNDPRHLRQFALDTGYEAHSILCVPLRVEGRVIGVVQVLNKTNDEPFTVHHQQLLMDLTQWAAIALQNARLFDERVRAYQRLEAEQERRIAAETRGAMATVVLDMAHTMNNIIGAIRAWALTLEQTPTTPPDLSQQLAGAIRQNAEEAIDLIRTLRGPLEQPAIEPTSVPACLERALQSCWCPDAIQVTIVHSPDVPLVSANAPRLEAVFQNLLANAIQALADEPGTIEVHTSRAEAGWAAISIRDNGPGIAPELQERLFTPGVSDKQGRLGIGLWLVDTFIRQFGGHIRWTSTAGEGTTFRVALPPAAAQSAEEEEQ
jgi:signal transduction histidine kinase